jgi:general nucleoside transport system ATP-binding protein
MQAICKAYPGVVANDDISVDLLSGEIHAILGENGAGKSTLMAILFGLQKPDSGRILIGGQEVSIRGPRDAIRHGIGFVQQHFSLIPTLTVLDNIVLTRSFGAGSDGDRNSCLRSLKTIKEEFGLEVDPDATIEELSVVDQQKVELLKALVLDPKILILDEPAALLSGDDVAALNGILQRLAARGYGIILIGHKLNDILSVADRISVLRRGRKVATLDAADASAAELSRLIVGDLKPIPERLSSVQAGEPILEIENLSVHSDRGVLAVDHVTLSLRAGEIVGLAGLAGSGQIELLEAVAGIRPVSGGGIGLAGEEMSKLSIVARQALGVAYIPPDRHRDGLIGSISIAENLAIRSRASLGQMGILQAKRVSANAQAIIDTFDIRSGGRDVLVATLSGGNQQKTVLGRELARGPRVILCCYPTRGLDFAAANAVHAHLRRSCDAGAAAIVASLDLDELLAVSDRIVVMQGGRFQGELPRNASSTMIGMMLGGEAVPL